MINPYFLFFSYLLVAIIFWLSGYSWKNNKEVL